MRGIGVVALVGVLLAPTVGAAEPVRTVVLELFTSQGCSSCPPADRLLSQLGQAGEAAGARVVPLAFHVDYWDGIGWEDPFASAEWSERQRWYARAFESSRVYTPQLVVDGRLEVVGSDREEVLAAIGERAERSGELEVEIEEARIEGEPPRLLLSLRLAGMPGSAPDTVAIEVAVFESGFETAVDSGENARRTLRNDYVVRRLAAGGPWPASGEERREIEVELDPQWASSRLGVAVFAQDEESLEIVGADVATPRSQ